jgi:uncharacterized damage-inducible protein DinB
MAGRRSNRGREAPNDEVMNTDRLRTLFAYNQWANGRLLDAAAHVKAEDFTRELGASHGSVRGTLVHVVFGEWDWLRLWLGDSAKEIAEKEPPPEAFPDVATLHSAWVTIVRDQQAFIDALEDEVLNAVSSFEGFQGEPWKLSLADTMQHVLNHSSYHRGQVVTLLRQLGHTPPNTDFLIFLREERQP